MIAFIDQYHDRFGVELICQTLAWHRQGGFMAARGYRAAKQRVPSPRAVRDCELIPILVALHCDNYSGYGVHEMWHAMRRAGHDIGRDQVARLMRTAGLTGVVRGRKPVSTQPTQAPDMRPDLVQRNYLCAST